MKEKLGSIPEVTKQISDMTSEFRLLDQETMKGLEPSKPYETFQGTHLFNRPRPLPGHPRIVGKNAVQ